jgi:uncharacterized membrane protein
VRRWVARGLALLAAAALVHLLVVHLLPSFLMGVAMARIAGAAAANVAVFPPRPDATSRGVVRPSPDLLYGVCAFDVREGPLRIRAEVPLDAYWSLSMFAANTDNFFVVNDRQSGGGALVDVVLAQPGAVVDVPPGAELVEAPSGRGIVLTRKLYRARRTLVCMPLARAGVRGG